MKNYKVKSEGKKKIFKTGMQREVTNKIRYDLIYLPMLERWAKHMTNGAKKYSDRNWEKAETQEELDRFVESAFRHFIQWLNGEEDEDHASAVWFNICGAEHVKEKFIKKQKDYLLLGKLIERKKNGRQKV